MQRKVKLGELRPAPKTPEERAEERAEEALRWQRLTALAFLATTTVSLGTLIYAVLRGQ